MNTAPYRAVEPEPEALTPLERVHRLARFVKPRVSEGPGYKTAPERVVYVDEKLWLELKRWCFRRYPHWYGSAWITVDDLCVYAKPFEPELRHAEIGGLASSRKR